MYPIFFYPIEEPKVQESVRFFDYWKEATKFWMVYHIKYSASQICNEMFCLFMHAIQNFKD